MPESKKVMAPKTGAFSSPYNAHCQTGHVAIYHACISLQWASLTEKLLSSRALGCFSGVFFFPNRKAISAN